MLGSREEQPPHQSARGAEKEEESKAGSIALREITSPRCFRHFLTSLAMSGTIRGRKDILPLHLHLLSFCLVMRGEKCFDRSNLSVKLVGVVRRTVFLNLLPPVRRRGSRFINPLGRGFAAIVTTSAAILGLRRKQAHETTG